jgi:hypothetical protein
LVLGLSACRAARTTRWLATSQLTAQATADAEDEPEPLASLHPARHDLRVPVSTDSAAEMVVTAAGEVDIATAPELADR